MFETMRRELKLQQELFLAFTVDRLVPPQSPKTQLAKSGVPPRPNTPIPGTPRLGALAAEADLVATNANGFPEGVAEDASGAELEEKKEETVEEKRLRKEREERELIMDRILEEVRSRLSNP